MLARAPEDVTVGSVVRLLEVGQALVKCFAATGSDCTIMVCCRLKSRLRSAEVAFLAKLDRFTFANIALPLGLALRISANAV